MMKVSLTWLAYLGSAFLVSKARARHTCYPFLCEDAPPCGVGYVCHDMASPYQPWCPIHAHCIPSCENFACTDGYECRIADNFPTCVPEQVDGETPINHPSSCAYGEAWNHKTGQCVPFSCHSDKACNDDEFCLPQNPPNIPACHLQYWQTGEPCMHYKCLDEDPCPENFCEDVEGTVCQLNPNNGSPACYCDEPFYTYNAKYARCDPASCQAPTACTPGDAVCVPTLNPGQGDPAFACAEQCPTGTELDALDNTCKPVSCDAEGACPDIFGLECVNDTGITCVRAPCAQFECTFVDDYDPCVLALCPEGYVCEARAATDEDCPAFQDFCPPTVAECVLSLDPCDEGYALDSHANCVPVTCEAPDACPSPATCMDLADPPATCDDEPCREYDCEWPADYNPCAAATCEIGSTCQVFDATEDDCPPFVDFCPPTVAKCVPTCAEGEEFDGTTHACVAVSCEAASACRVFETCHDVQVDCGTSTRPCPQFACVHNVCYNIHCGYGSICVPALHNPSQPTCVCPEGTTWNPYKYHCV